MAYASYQAVALNGPLKNAQLSGSDTTIQVRYDLTTGPGLSVERTATYNLQASPYGWVRAPQTFLSDTFTDTTGTALTAHTGDAGAVWLLQNGYAPASPNLINSSGRVYSQVASAAYQAGGLGQPTTGADYYVEADLFFASSVVNDTVAVCGRMANASDTLYSARYSVPAGGWMLHKFVAASATQLGSTVTLSFPTGLTKTLRLTMIGTTITLSVDGTSTISVTDSAIDGSLGVAAGMRYTVGQTSSTGIHMSSITGVE